MTAEIVEMNEGSGFLWAKDHKRGISCGRPDMMHGMHRYHSDQDQRCVRKAEYTYMISTCTSQPISIFQKSSLYGRLHITRF